MSNDVIIPQGVISVTPTLACKLRSEEYTQSYLLPGGLGSVRTEVCGPKFKKWPTYTDPLLRKYPLLWVNCKQISKNTPFFGKFQANLKKWPISTYFLPQKNHLYWLHVPVYPIQEVPPHRVSTIVSSKIGGSFCPISGFGENSPY